jgi:hypothetical protein
LFLERKVCVGFVFARTDDDDVPADQRLQLANIKNSTEPGTKKFRTVEKSLARASSAFYLDFCRARWMTTIEHIKTTRTSRLSFYDNTNNKTIMSEEEAAPKVEERRMVIIAVTPSAGVDPNELFARMKSTITSTPEYKLKWEDECQIEDGKVKTTFTIALEADFDEEVMDHIEMMEGVAGQMIIYQTAME